MLLNFRTKNFKSFKNGFDLSLRPSAIKDLKDSVLVSKLTNEKEVRALSSSVIYGPNAAGKTSLLESIYYFQNIILNGGLIEKDNIFLSNGKTISLVPFMYDSYNEPIEFEIEFEENKNIYKYGLKINVGKFADFDFEKNISEEYLSINDKEIFKRNETELLINYKKLDNNFLNEGFESKIFGNYLKIMTNNLEKDRLFLSTDFSSFVSKSLYNTIYNWIANKLIVFMNFNELKYSMAADNKEIINLPKELYDAVYKIGVIGSELKYKKSNENENDIKLFSNIKINDKQTIMIPSKLIESFGTLKFIDLFPAVVIALVKGGTLVIDELDNGLHPMVIRSIINIFHDRDINRKNSQLIFNTHNPIYLNFNCFRRDEICFVEKDKETKISELYKLSDFKTNSENPIRNTTDYVNGYFKNKFGAIEYVDLSDVCEGIMNQIEEVENGEKSN